METNEAMSALKLLKDRIINCDSVKAEYEKASKRLKEAESQQPTAVNDFDRNHKQEYVISQIGEEPIEPKGIIKLAVPVYLSKKKAFEREYAEYRIKYKTCVSEYYEKYADQRSKLEAEERSKILCNIHIATQRYESAKEKYAAAKKELDADTTVSEKLKRVDVVDALIVYFQDQRADNLKEAINLYYEEEHRRRLEEFAQEQVRLTAEATELARQAAESAAEAASSADEAISEAERAMSRANEAYERADEAYSEAESAYWAASSKDDY